MNEPVIMTKKVYVQKDFGEHTRQWLMASLGIASDERLLCAVWLHPLLRHGFVITDKALRWRLTSDADGLRTAGTLHKAPAPAADFSITAAVTGGTATSTAKTASEELSRLEITADGRRYAFFIRGLTEAKGQTLCDILKFGYQQGVVPQADMGDLVQTVPLPAVRNAFDAVLVFAATLPQKLRRKPAAAASAQEQSASGTTSDAHAAKNADASANDASAANDGATATSAAAAEQRTDAGAQPQTATAAQPAPRQQKSAKERVVGALLSLVDVCASLLFVASVVIAIKPELLPLADADAASRTYAVIKYVGKHCMSIEVAEKVSPALEAWRTLFVGIGLILYGLLKLVVIFATKGGGRKIVSLLLVAMMFLACALIAKSFLIFIAFCLLLYLAFEYSCGLSTARVCRRLLVLAIGSAVCYLAVHLLQHPQVFAELAKIDFRLPVRRWF